MRDLVFKNLTSSDRKKKIIYSCEVIRKRGMHTTIRRHFVCKVFEIKDIFKEKPLAQVYISRNLNRIRHQKSFFCRMKASLYAKNKGRLFLILFGHSLKIDSKPIVSLWVYPVRERSSLTGFTDCPTVGISPKNRVPNLSSRNFNLLQFEGDVSFPLFPFSFPLEKATVSPVRNNFLILKDKPSYSCLPSRVDLPVPLKEGS